MAQDTPFSPARLALPGPSLAVAVLLALGACPAPACDTPVHRYAMYSWEPAAYTILYLYRGKEDPADREANELLAPHGSEPQAPPETPRAGAHPNVRFLARDLERSETREEIPEEILERASSLPAHLVVGPRGEDVYAGRLSADDARALVDSPLRRKLAELLCADKSGVLLFVTHRDPEKAARARREVERAIALAAGAQPEAGPQAAAPAGGEAAPVSFLGAPGPFQVGLVTLDREDPKEAWLWRLLLSVEKLTAEELDNPLVYPLYGRGRALEPCLGAGITAENLLDAIFFINGPCSCQVKDMNPGVDLLMTWDWHACAVALARRIGEETGNWHLLADAAAAGVAAALPALPSASADAAGVPGGASPESGASSAGPRARAVTPPAAAGEEPPREGPETRGAAPPQARAGEERSFGERLAWTLLGGLAALSALVALAGLWFLRRRARPV